MKITIEFHEEAIRECCDENEITYSLLQARFTRFCNSTVVLKMLLEGTVVDPFPGIH